MSPDAEEAYKNLTLRLSHALESNFDEAKVKPSKGGYTHVTDDSSGTKYYKDGVFHREDGPAVIRDYGDKEWWINGQRHREDGPAVEGNDGRQEWWKNGDLHREDGPAIDDQVGKSWYINGQLHREDGPAVDHSDGGKGWYRNGNMHREDGPAAIYPDGSESWYLNGEKVEPFVNREDLHVRNFDESDGGVRVRKDSLGNIWHSRNGLRHREDGPAIEYVNGTKKWYLYDELHREDGPACEFHHGNKEWYKRGQRHREDGPAVELATGTKEYWLGGKQVEPFAHRKDLHLNDFDESIISQLLEHGTSSPDTICYYKPGTYLLHREDGPARIYANGDKEWWLNGTQHREDGPAYDGEGGKWWFIHGKNHREDGPAVETSDGRKYWYLNGEEVEPFTNREDMPSTNFDESQDQDTSVTSEDSELINIAANWRLAVSYRANSTSYFATIKVTYNPNTDSDYSSGRGGRDLAACSLYWDQERNSKYTSDAYLSSYERFIDSFNLDFPREDSNDCNVMSQMMIAVTNSALVQKMYQQLKNKIAPDRSGMLVADFDESTLTSLREMLIY